MLEASGVMIVGMSTRWAFLGNRTTPLDACAADNSGRLVIGWTGRAGSKQIEGGPVTAMCRRAHGPIGDRVYKIITAVNLTVGQAVTGPVPVFHPGVVHPDRQDART